jgi:AsmA protein
VVALYNSSELPLLREARMQKHWLKIVAGLFVLLLLVVVAIPFLVNAETFRPTIQTRLSTALGRPITLGHLSFSLLKGSLVAEDIAIADDPAFSTTPFLQAKSLQIGVEVVPLVMHRQVRITTLTIDTPSINLLHGANGRWNFSTLGNASTSQSSQGVTALPDLTVGELKIKDGSASVATVPAERKPFVYSSIDLAVQQFSFLNSFPFQLSAILPASGSLSLNGHAGPLNPANAAATPVQATLALKQFDPVASGILEQGTGISMVLDIDAETTSDGTTVTSKGKVQASHLHLARTGSPAPQPVNIDFAIADDLVKETGQITQLAIHSGQVAAHVAGSYRMTPKAILLDLHLNAPNLPIDQVEQLLPVFGVELPTGSQLKGGTLSANLSVSGPAAATTINGPIEIDNTTLAGFDIGSRIQGLNLFKSGGGTQIQMMRTTVTSSPQITAFKDITGNLPQIGTATGSGTVAPSGALDFKMSATLSSNNVVGAVANQAMNTVGNYIGGFLHPNQKPAASNASRPIPLTITGTASSPTIRANVVAMFK